jgi:hypothetical protein
MSKEYKNINLFSYYNAIYNAEMIQRNLDINRYVYSVLFNFKLHDGLLRKALSASLWKLKLVM